ncbi:hypothetical protein F2Q70_00001699 [Brassica cretica]|uniref:Uncharacterized protein n=1 Tax=Brassica cretica TaxID=69181 RepID=A0A8S9IQT9_BRACR|nr:hypothetical protein F2Q70_00001699 [Brassica cretica]
MLRDEDRKLEKIRDELEIEALELSFCIIAFDEPSILRGREDLRVRDMPETMEQRHEDLWKQIFKVRGGEFFWQLYRRFMKTHQADA